MSSAKYIYIVQVTRQLSIDILNNFAKEGKEIHLITGIVESNYEQLDPSIKVTRLIKHNTSSGFKRLFAWGIFTFISFFLVLFSNKKNELILVTTPPFIIFLGLFFKKIRKQKYHLIIWDLYPDVLTNLGVMKESSFIIKIWRKLNVSCFGKADTLFTLGQHLSSAIKKYTDKDPVIIPNWTNSDFLKPVARQENPFAVKYKLTDKLVVMYSGNLGMTHDIESIVNTAALLKENTNIHFVIIGEGAKKTKIIKMVEEKKLENVLILPYQDKETLPYSLGCADIGVVTLSQGAENISVPSKTYYMLAAGSAILALSSKESELGILIENYQCGRVFDNADAKDIGEFILGLYENSGELNRYKVNSRTASLNFTPKNAELYYKYICNN
jgi:glycosyltransferase involved in cell wall biosynthesis